MHTILLTFDTEHERHEFIELIKDAANRLEVLGAQNETQAMWQPRLKKLLDTAIMDAQVCKCDNPTPEKHALFVAGKKMCEGTLSEMQQRFQQEINQHSGSVQIRALRNEGWTTIRQRVKR